ncbi:FtsX-like permease family protein [Candidatus Peregrinibacteria bacterium]|nr:MAG: FtsX-like permease family protein [Candidatus Peregrinibacteria bacterium]
MRLSEVFRLSLILLSRKKIRSSFCAISIGIGVFFCLIFFGIGSTVNTLFFIPLFEEQNQNELLIVKTKKSSIDFFLGNGKLTEKDVEVFRNTEGVTAVGRQLLLGFPNSLRINMFGFVFETDSPIFGVDPLIANISPEEFTKNERGVPSILSPQLLLLYNSTIADASLGVSRFSEEEILGKSFSFLFGSSSLLGVSLTQNKNQEEKGYIAALSPFVPAIGVSIPLGFAQEINKKIGNISPENSIYTQVFLQADSAKSAAYIEKKLSQKGYFIQNAETLRSEMRNILFSFFAVLILTGGIILSLSILLLSSFFSALITQHAYDIGLLLILGMQKKKVFLIFGAQALLLVGIGTCLGFFGAFSVFSLLLQKITDVFFGNTILFSELFFPKQEIILFAVFLLLTTLLFILLPLVFFFKKEPLEILQK